MQKLNLTDAPYEKKEKVIRAKMLPVGLFGSETLPRERIGTAEDEVEDSGQVDIHH